MDVAAALALARELGIARLDAQLLIAHHLGRPRAWLLAHDDVDLGSAEPVLLAALRERAAGVPLAYLVGTREFHGLTLGVSPAVLVPRPETELLVDWAIELVGKRAATVVDLGTGSGAIAIALKCRRPAAAVTATDASASALDIARANAKRLGISVEFVAGDWWQPLAGCRYDVAVSNPPYVAARDPHLQALTHEPLSALASGVDGLDALRAIVAGASAHLAPGGWLLLEHGHDQDDAVRLLLAGNGFVDVATRSDLAGLPRCTGGRRPG